EARISFHIYADKKGNWSSEIDKLLKSFTKIRIEIQSGNKPFIPLIDGPVVGYEIYMSSKTGKSYVTIIVQDDSVLLNLNDEIIKFEARTDGQIVQEIFNSYGLVPEIEWQNIKTPPLNPPLDFIQRGTAIQVLKKLAKRQGMSFCILPGRLPGKSRGCFFNLSTRVSDLTPLILLGNKKNIEYFSVKNDAQKISKIEASSIRIASKEISTSISNIQDIPLLGDKIGSESALETPTRRLPPHQDATVDLDNAVLAEAKRSSYTIQAEGKILSNKYPDILSPYQVISVYGVKPKISGDYLIRGVTHNISPSQYGQTFRLLRNAQTEIGLKTLGDDLF
ncbi:MAG: hypothetical protein ACFFG0_06665, partial [Candidatus Thorarchaeota archaeon]